MPDGWKRRFRSEKQKDWYGFYRTNRWARRFMGKEMNLSEVRREFKEKKV